MLISIFAAGLAYFGWSQISSGMLLQKQNRRNEAHAVELFMSDPGSPMRTKGTLMQAIQILIILISAFGIALLVTTSIEISFAISLLITAIPFFLAKRKLERNAKLQELAWPLAIDGLVSSLQAGRSITEAIQDLSSFGPEALIPSFKRVEEFIEAGEALETILCREMRFLDNSAADQTITTLLIAKEFGGRDVTVTLRLLSEFLREDIEAQEEIRTRFGWVRNSALLGAGAPWLILLLLSTREDTVRAYESSAGKTILSIGVIATAIAFIWMERVARLPKPARPLKP